MVFLSQSERNFFLSAVLLWVMFEIITILELDECESAPCLNDGACEDQFAAFNCECTTDWIGTTCAGKCIRENLLKFILDVFKGFKKLMISTYYCKQIYGELIFSLLYTLYRSLFAAYISRD